MSGGWYGSGRWGRWIESPVPHGVYQGSVLEGIVIQYVPYKDCRYWEEGTHWKKLMEFALRFREIKESVPLPGGGGDGTLLGADLRKILQNVNNDDDQFRMAVE